MLFLVQIEFQFPHTMTQAERDDLIRRETEASVAFMRSGREIRPWRVAGKAASVSLWDFDTLEALDAALKSLPIFPWFTRVEITPLIEQPSLRAYKAQYGAVPGLDGRAGPNSDA